MSCQTCHLFLGSAATRTETNLPLNHLLAVTHLHILILLATHSTSIALAFQLQPAEMSGLSCTKLAATIEPSKRVEKVATLCEKHVAKKRFHFALDLVNAAINDPGNDNSQHRVTLLDVRVTVYIRMQSWALALEDAKSMISLDRKDARGYLRCARVARDTGDASTAIQYLRRGLELVPASSSDQKLLVEDLENTKDHIRAQVVYSRPRDPMTVLPLEVVEDILLFVNHRQHVRMLRVCRSWNEILHSSRSLTETLAFPGEQRNITPKWLNAALGRVKCPKTVQIANLSDSSIRTVMGELLTVKFSTVQSLDLQGKWCTPEALPVSYYNLRYLNVGWAYQIHMDWVYEVIRDCTELEVAKFAHVRKSPSATLALSNRNLRVLELECMTTGYRAGNQLIAPVSHEPPPPRWCPD